MITDPPHATFDWRNLRQADIERLAGSIDRDGYAVIANLLSAEDVDCARAVGNDLLDDGGRMVVKVGQAGLRGHILSRLHKELQPFFCDLFRHMTGASAVSTHVQQDARFLPGKKANPVAPYYHFDSYVIGLIVPLCLPDPGNGGEFIMLPNARPMRQRYLTNVVQKAFYDSRFVQRRLPRLLSRHPRATQLPMTVGQAYLFNGYRSLHANAPCIGDQRRFTVVFHFGNPHAASQVRHLGKKVRRGLASMMLASGIRPPRRLTTSDDHEQMPNWNLA